MDEKTRHKRALEDISHFFLSGKQPQGPPEEGTEKETSDHTAEGVLPADGQTSEAGNIPVGKAPELRIARPAATTIENKQALVTAARDYVHTAHGGDLADVKSMDSPRFGTAELTLFDKRNFCVLCGKIQYDTPFADFLTTSVGYYGWFSDCLRVGSLFFNRSPRLILYLFCDQCPPTGSFMVEQLGTAMSILLVRYHILLVPGDTSPIAYFQPLVPGDGEGLLQERQPTDFSEADWRRFNRLKERASEQ